jgi:hypothetical protein
VQHHISAGVATEVRCSSIVPQWRNRLTHKLLRWRTWQTKLVIPRFATIKANNDLQKFVCVCPSNQYSIDPLGLKEPNATGITPAYLDSEAETLGLAYPKSPDARLDASTQTDHVIVIAPLPESPKNTQYYARVESVHGGENEGMDSLANSSYQFQQFMNGMEPETGEKENNDLTWDESVNRVQCDQPSKGDAENESNHFDRETLHQNQDHDPYPTEATNQAHFDRPSTARAESQGNHVFQRTLAQDEDRDPVAQILENGFIKLNTHDTSQASRKIPNIATFAKDLEEAVNSALLSGNKSRYKNVYVLLLSWTDDDLDVDEEVNQLGRAFSQYYNFEVQYFKIPRISPGWSTNSRVISFIQQGGIDSLLILYYAGHARLGHQVQPPIWAAYVSLKFKFFF